MKLTCAEVIIIVKNIFSMASLAPDLACQRGKRCQDIKICETSDNQETSAAKQPRLKQERQECGQDLYKASLKSKAVDSI